MTVEAPRPTLVGIVSRLLARVAIVLASLAWAGFVFTETVGDPGRGDRIAAAVLADDAARSEVVGPIATTVMNTYGLPAEQRPLVEHQVDLLLVDPVGARSFVDPFAGSWARLLGEDDPRPAEFDLAPLLSRFTATAGLDGVAVPDRLPVPGVPLPRTRISWMDGVRSAISAAVLPLALLSAASFAIAFAIGDRGRVLRRLGVWAILAGLAWVAIPPALVWLARRWVGGADAVVAVALDEAVSGLSAAAFGLVAGGCLAFLTSFALRPSQRPVPVAAARPERSAARGIPSATRAPVPGARTRPARRRTVAATAEMPVVPAGARPVSARPTASPADGDGDSLWDYYAAPPS